MRTQITRRNYSWIFSSFTSTKSRCFLASNWNACSTARMSITGFSTCWSIATRRHPSSGRRLCSNSSAAYWTTGRIIRATRCLRFGVARNPRTSWSSNSRCSSTARRVRSRRLVSSSSTLTWKASSSRSRTCWSTTSWRAASSTYGKRIRARCNRAFRRVQWARRKAWCNSGRSKRREMT